MGSKIVNYFKNLGKDWKNRLRKFVLSAPFWVLIVGIGLCIGFGINAYLVNFGRYDSRMANNWGFGSENPFRHVAVYAGGARYGGESSPAVYLDASHSLKHADINILRTSLQAAVDTGKTVAKDKGLNEDGSPNGWEDCYSSFLRDDITFMNEGGRPITVNSEIIGVGGNFKAFHPFMFQSGGFLPVNPVDTNQIVLNDVLSWRFFNSCDVVGRQVEILGETFTVVGVVSEPLSSVDREAKVNEPRAYIYFNRFGMWLGGSSEESDMGMGLEPAILCYEAMLPEMVKNVAVTDLKNALPNYNVADPGMYVVSVTGRYNLLRLWDYMMPIGETNRTLSKYELPYWETTAGIASTRLCVDCIFIFVGIILVILGVIMTVLRSRKFAASIIEQENNQ